MQRWLIGLWLYVLCVPAWAHVKWFVEFDVSDPPKPIAALWEQPLFWSLLLLSMIGVFAGSLVDTTWSKWHFFTLRPWFPRHHRDLVLSIVRLGTGIFFIAIWLVGGVILTPDLISDAPHLAYVQLISAFSLLFNRTLALAGFGLLYLYVYAVAEFGIFHMLDYSFFLGVAFFLILSQFPTQQDYRMRIVTLSVGFAFMWSALEKIAYPFWFDPFLDQYPDLLMGLDRGFFVMSAAFVEFSLFYMLVVCRNGMPLVALMANLLITTGNIYFGKVDALGHFMANVLLVAIMLSNKPLPRARDVYVWFNASKTTLLFLLALVVLFTLYYGLHWYLYE